MKIRSFQLIVFSFVVFLGGCASGAKRENMVYAPYQSQFDSYDSKLSKNVSVKAIGGGKGTNPLWTSQVSDPEFAGALMASLDVAGLLSQSGKYNLDAYITNIEQPLMGVNFTVTASIHYRLTDLLHNRVVYEKTLSTPYTAAFGDALYGVTRLRLANEGAVRENIKAFLIDLARLNLSASGRLPSSGTGTKYKRSVEERIKALDNLRKNGLITEEEYIRELHQILG